MTSKSVPVLEEGLPYLIALEGRECKEMELKHQRSPNSRLCEFYGEDGTVLIVLVAEDELFDVVTHQPLGKIYATTDCRAPQ